MRRRRGRVLRLFFCARFHARQRFGEAALVLLERGVARAQRHRLMTGRVECGANAHAVCTRLFAARKKRARQARRQYPRRTTTGRTHNVGDACNRSIGERASK